MKNQDTSFKAKLKALTQKKIFTLICLYVAMVVIFTVWAELRHTHFLTVPVFKNILNSLVVTSFLTLGAGCLLISAGELICAGVFTVFRMIPFTGRDFSLHSGKQLLLLFNATNILNFTHQKRR